MAPAPTGNANPRAQPPPAPAHTPRTTGAWTTRGAASALLAVAAAVAAAAAGRAAAGSARHLLPPMTAGTLPPAWAYRPLQLAVAALDGAVSAFTPPNLALFRHIMGYVHTVEVYTAAELGVADALAHGPMTSDDLARAVSPCAAAPPDAPAGCAGVALRLARVLRALAVLGVFAEAAPGVWANTPASECLRADAPASLRAAALNFGGVQLRMLEQLPATVVTGEASFARVHGDEFWRWYGAHPREHATFDSTMRELGALGGADAAIASDFDWTGGGAVGTVVDVGGGLGDMLAGVLARHGSLAGVVFDLAPVIERARARWALRDVAALAPRVSLVAGDAFDAATVPSRAHPRGAAAGATDAAARALVAATAAAAAAGPAGGAGRVEVCDDDAPPAAAAAAAATAGGAFAYALRDIVHDWPDGDVVRMLAALRDAMRAGDGLASCRWAEWRTPPAAADAPCDAAGGDGACGTAPMFVTGVGRRAWRAADGSAAAPRPPSPRDRLLLVTRVLDPGEGFVASEGTADADVVMLGAFGTTAGERTLVHLSSLLRAAGFQLVARHRVRGRYSVVHAEPA